MTRKACNSILETIGDTPLIKLNKVTKDLPCKVYAKVDYFNPGNSIKDRMALQMVLDAEQSGLLKPGGTIIECTSGNTGMGLALAAVVKGYKCIFTTTDKQSKSKIDILKALGAEVIVCPTNVEPEDPRSYYSVARKLANEIPNSFHCNQYDNLSNRKAHYLTTGPEIWEQTDGKVTHVVVATGTGGTATGIAQFLKEKNPNIKIWCADPYGSLLKKFHETGKLDMGEVHPYLVEGIGEDFVPMNYNFELIDFIDKVGDKESALMARRISKEEGIFVGWSAGSALQCVMQLKDQLKNDDLVVVIFHDHGSRYVAKIYNDDWMKERGFLVEDRPTVKSILESRSVYQLISISKDSLVKDAFHTLSKADVSQLPVVDDKGKIIGSITESTLMRKLLDTPSLRDQKVADVMDKAFPEVKMDDYLDGISKYFSQDNSAVLVKDHLSQWQIITKFDIIKAVC